MVGEEGTSATAASNDLCCHEDCSSQGWQEGASYTVQWLQGNPGKMFPLRHVQDVLSITQA